MGTGEALEAKRARERKRYPGGRKAVPPGLARLARVGMMQPNCIFSCGDMSRCLGAGQQIQLLPSQIHGMVEEGSGVARKAVYSGSRQSRPAMPRRSACLPYSVAIEA